jgi:hypothetical protein
VGKISPNFDLKYMISKNPKVFHGKNDPNSEDFEKKIIIQIIRFL